MGIFSELFGPSSDIEKQLEKIYVPRLESLMTSSQAKKTFSKLLMQAKEEAKKEGTTNMLHNFGDYLLENEHKDPKIKTMLSKKRKEGIRDEDIRWWWNMHDLERRLMLKIDFMFGLALYTKLIKENGLDKQEAGKKVRKTHPLFGDPDDITHGTGDNRPLPYELKDRINIYIQERNSIDPTNFKKELEKSLTFNALVRREIGKGKI